MNSGIYKITNLINSKKYIGKSVNLKRRLKQHKTGKYSNNHLQNAIKKYGIENFTFQIIEFCSVENLSIRERYWIYYYNSNLNGYNNTDGGENAPGWHFTEQAKNKMKVPKSEEFKVNLTKQLEGNTNSVEYWNDEENRAKQSTKTRQRWNDEDYRNSHMNGQKNYKNSKKKEEDDQIRIQKITEFNNRPEEKEKRSIKMQGNKIGEGRIHINNGQIRKMIYPNELEYYLEQGFVLGRGKLK